MRGHLISSGNQDVIRLIGKTRKLPTQRHKDCLFVCSYNCRTIASDADLRTLLLRSRQIKYDVIAIQETKGRTETIRKTDHNELLIVEAKTLTKSSVHASLFLRLLTKDQGAISIINGYAPTSTATDEEREEFYQLLEDTIQNERTYYKYVVGDFNALIGTNHNGDWRLGPHGNATVRNAEREKA
ncbi:hypothetical protein COOONC_01811 [Cooperia oncophora]